MFADVNQATILAERAEIEREISGRTLCDLLEDNASRYPDAPAASWRGDVVALMMSNRPEHLIADQAAVYLGAIPTTLYGTLAPEQIRYCAAHCAAKVAIVEDRAVAERWQALRADLPALEHLVLLSGVEHFGSIDFGMAPGALGWDELLDRAATARQADRAGGAGSAGSAGVAALRARVSPEDPITVLYTSGTTGPPKGVIVTHHSELYECAAIARRSCPTALPSCRTCRWRTSPSGSRRSTTACCGSTDTRISVPTRPRCSAMSSTSGR